MPANDTVLAYIRNAAAKRGWDPNIFEKVSRAEALNVFDPSKPDLGGDEGSSFGPFQLHYGGMSKNMPNPGMGDDFTRATGLHASDPSTWPKQVDFVMDHFANGGTWSPWMGAKAAGITGRQGIQMGAPVGAVTAGAPQSITSIGSGQSLPALDAAPGLPDAPVASAGMTLGDKMGNAIFGDETAAALKKAFGTDAPANSPAKQGLGLLSSALGGGKDEERAAFNREASTINPSSISVDDSAQRMQAGTQLMASLMAARRKKPTGLSMGV